MNRRGARVAAFAALALAVAALIPACDPPPPPEAGWRELEPGLEIGRFHLCDEAAPAPPSLVVVRADPGRFDVTALAASARPDRAARSARDWARAGDLAVVINAGMFHPDYLRHVGYMVLDGHVNNGVPVASYRSVLAFDPVGDDGPRFVLADLDRTSLDDLRDRYRSLVQNLRMIDADGRNVWEPSERRAATAALGVDRRGRLLFLFDRTPRSTHDLVECLLRSPLDLARAQYLEGGPEAVLFVDAGERPVEFRGSWSPVSGDAVGPELVWPVPNVLGLVRRSDTESD